MDTLELITTNEFWQENRRFFEAGLLRLVYSGETFCICNMCNSYYVTFDLVRLHPGDMRHGLRSTINQVRAMVDDEGYFIRWLDHLYNNGSWQKRVVSLNDATFAWMMAVKAETDATGPSSRVDPGYENWLYQRGAGRK